MNEPCMLCPEGTAEYPLHRFERACFDCASHAWEFIARNPQRTRRANIKIIKHMRRKYGIDPRPKTMSVNIYDYAHMKLHGVI